MYNIIDLNFKNIFSFFIFQLIFIKIKSVDLYSLEDDTSNNRDKTLDDCIFKGYTFYNKYVWKCFRLCGSDQNRYTVDKGDEQGNCFTTRCPPNYPYKDTVNHKCVKKCDNYYCDKNCVNNCNGCSSGEYYFANEKNCITFQNCENRGSNDLPIYYDSSTKKCDFSCNNFGNKFVNPNDKPIIECKSDCDTGLFHYENEYLCLSTCNYFYQYGSNICLYECSPKDNNKFVDFTDSKYYCVNSCSKYYKRETITLDGKEFTVDKCIQACTLTDYNEENRCYDNQCPENKRYNYDNKCIDKCPSNTYVDHEYKKCYKDSDGCPTSSPYYERDETNNYFICKKSCTSDKFIKSKTELECVNSCASPNIYIGINNMCLSSCEEPRIYYTKLKVDNLYKCSLDCNGKFTVKDTKECVDVCPPTHYESPNKICYKDNCDSDPDYKIATELNSKKICSNTCYKDYPYLNATNKCTDDCRKEHKMPDEFNKICITNCDSNPTYKYYYNNKTYEACYERCPPDMKYHIGYTCYENCEYPNNVVEEYECKSYTICKILKNITNGYCLENCKDIDKYYYEDNPTNCLDKCNDDDFVFNDTHICVKECPLSYFMYYDDNATINNKMCVLKCPEKKIIL